MTYPAVNTYPSSNIFPGVDGAVDPEVPGGEPSTVRYYVDYAYSLDTSIPYGPVWEHLPTIFNLQSRRQLLPYVPVWTNQSQASSINATKQLPLPSMVATAQMVTPAFEEARTLAGSFRAVFPVAFIGDANLCAHVYVIKSDLSVRGVLDDVSTSIPDYFGAQRTQTIEGSLSGLGVQAGDRIVFEFGFEFIDGLGGSANFVIADAGLAIADYPYQSNLNEDYQKRPWIEVSLEGPPPPVEVVDHSIIWDDPNERYFETGLDHGVIYPRNGDPVPWNGLKSLDEAGGGTKTILYRDGRIFYADVEPGDFEGSLTAFFYPDTFAECAGIPQIANGLLIDNQKPKRFGLSYRTLVGSGFRGDIFGYQIHLVYNALAVIGSRARRTLTNSPEMMEFNFDLIATPVKLPGLRPSAHFIIDTRFLDAAMLAHLEGILYGSMEGPARLPEPMELFDIMHFGSAITIVDNGDGTWTARGSSANLIDNGDGTFIIKNVNGTDNGNGTFTIEDTP